MWGSYPSSPQIRHEPLVFSTSVGILFAYQFIGNINNGILHECGDPINTNVSNTSAFRVFSTSVGILSTAPDESSEEASILHECGDPIQVGSQEYNAMRYSPRVWGSYNF